MDYCKDLIIKTWSFSDWINLFDIIFDVIKLHLCDDVKNEGLNLSTPIPDALVQVAME
jgi:hypothetical protein